MAQKPPAFQFYVKDWLASKTVLRMTPQQCGYYINLMANAWDNDPPGTLPNDPAILWRLARAESREKFEADGALVLAQFPTMSHDRLRFNAKLLGEYKAQVRYKKEMARKANIRWSKELHATAYAAASPQQCSASASSSAFASASAVKRERERARLTAWPEEFSLNSELAAYAQDKGIKDPIAVWEHFENYYRAAGTRRKDWKRTWYTWVIKELQFTGGHTNGDRRSEAIRRTFEIAKRRNEADGL